MENSRKAWGMIVPTIYVHGVGVVLCIWFGVTDSEAVDVEIGMYLRTDFEATPCT